MVPQLDTNTNNGSFITNKPLLLSEVPRESHFLQRKTLNIVNM